MLGIGFKGFESSCRRSVSDTNPAVHNRPARERNNEQRVMAQLSMPLLHVIIAVAGPHCCCCCSALHPDMRRDWAAGWARLLAPGAELATIIFPVGPGA
jgi:hypothetical protein